ncbi:hypothetical protein ABZS95_10340 [Streptomyces sp. NPDC005479]
MITALLAHAPAYAIGAVLLLATTLCSRIERWYTRRAAATHTARKDRAA